MGTFVKQDSAVVNMGGVGQRPTTAEWGARQRLAHVPHRTMLTEAVGHSTCTQAAEGGCGQVANEKSRGVIHVTYIGNYQGEGTWLVIAHLVRRVKLIIENKA